MDLKMKGRLKFLIEDYAKAWSRYDKYNGIVSDSILEKQKKILFDLENNIANELKNYKYIEKNEIHKNTTDNNSLDVVA